MRFQEYAFSLSSKTHRSIRVRTTVLMRFRQPTLERSKTTELRVDLWRKLNSMCMLQTHAPAIFSVIFFILMRFRQPTLERSKTTELRVDLWRKLNSMCMLQTHAPAIFSVIFFILMRFRPSTVIPYERVFVLIHFQERFQIDAFSAY